MLLNASANTVVVDKNGHTAVYLAAEAGRMETTELLLRHDSQHWSIHETVLHLATKMGVTPVVQLLLDTWRSAAIPPDFQPNRTSARESITHMERDKYGRTTLHLAASQKDKGFVKALLDMNASHEARDRWDCTPLHAAAASKVGTTVVSLLHSGADKEAKDRTRMTPLIRVTCRGYTNEDKRRGAGSATAQAGKEKDGCGDEHYSHVKYLLLVERADANFKDCQGRTALYYAGEKGFCMITKHLLQFGAKIETTDEFGRTALHRAAAEGYDEIVKIHLTAYAKKDARDDRGQTALMLAAQPEPRTSYQSRRLY